MATQTHPLTLLREAQQSLEKILIVLGGPAVVPSSEATRIYERIRAVYPPETPIHLDAGFLWDNFQRDIGNQRDLYLNEDQIRRALMDLIEVGLLQGDPRKVVMWVA